ncbi:MAG: chemotaxis-specific protein-glutamate methyltransferase CheB [Archangium sp.]|nr:chemotaxis-specific protein-glutamate methyltransferase CheB [Archangium sp.]MDP3156404.1 chemotaxis-specific protein-glutamate methyltransferase CheB [Archangium sp.]MDP3573150.1 chemotaxis-specific protein-glutamate methyltransferase CheB [Archangium sp.]
MKPQRPITVLIVDDSAATRRALSKLLETAPGLEVVGRAVDGEDGLKKALQLKPDVITLDLEMPKMDGYAFLRLLMARQPTPVIVVSSYGHRSDVFKALQLGAFDFVARPTEDDDASFASVRGELIEKLRAAPFMRREDKTPPPSPKQKAPKPPAEETARLVLVGASTGGPPAVQKVLEALVGLPVCVVIAQHMPARFTQAFAERLDQSLGFRVSEAKTGDPILPGRVYVAPGGEQLELERRAGGTLALVVKMSSQNDAHAPSVDRLFTSAAKVAPPGTRALVLTGMGIDGAKGALALKKAGVEVWAEAEATAIVFGMPEAAIKAGAVVKVLPLEQLGPALAAALSA